MTKALFADISSYNPSSYAYMQGLTNRGCKGVVVKLTESTGYTNPYATSQINNAKKAGLKVSVYHFSRFTSVSSAQSEARYFLNAIKARHLDTTTTVVNDFETTHASVSALKAFFGVLEQAGYKNVSIYSFRNWFQAGYFNGLQGLKWVADWGKSKCSIACDAWQYTDSAYINGNRTDLSWDYSGAFTDSKYHGNAKSNSDREKDNQNTQNDKTKLAECYSLINMMLTPVFDKWLH